MDEAILETKSDLQSKNDFYSSQYSVDSLLEHLNGHSRYERTSSVISISNLIRFMLYHISLMYKVKKRDQGDCLVGPQTKTVNWDRYNDKKLSVNLQ